MSVSPSSAPVGEVTSSWRSRLLFTPAQRKPWRLPEQNIEIPPPPQSPAAPGKINLLISLLPPVLMVAGSLIYSLSVNQGTIEWRQVIPVVVMSVGFPLANFLNVQMQWRKYRSDLQAREARYKEMLAQTAERIEGALREQVETLNRAYPAVQELLSVSLRREEQKLWSLWARRRHDPDFMALRFGQCHVAPSFAIELPHVYDTNDPLQALPAQYVGRYHQAGGAPALLEFERIPSVAISNNSASRSVGLTRRLLLDALIHHSPEDLHLFVFAEGETLRRWEWLKWLPHVNALQKASGNYVPHLAFQRADMQRALEWMENEYETRRQANTQKTPFQESLPGILLVLDENGLVRQSELIRRLAAHGGEQRIYLLFVGGRAWPRECHAELRLYENHVFELIETHQRNALPLSGTFETVSLEECERIARLLAGIETSVGEASAQLPESLRVADVLGSGRLNLDSIETDWQQEIPPEEQLTFPIGLTARSGRLEVAHLTLLPDEIFGKKIPHGLGAYHTILIGTTGSGKSEFMKSLVLGAATRYSPSLLNFFFMDFKGGAAFGIYENLPHVSGAVTNLRPELVERGLDSIVNEIERRQRTFESARKAKDIWEYNYRTRTSDAPFMPHLILFLDEFAGGLRDFPRLREPLDLLVRQGRSLGMYLVLANQDVNAEVERLLSNVGWRIVLPVSRNEDLTTMIGRGYRIPDRKGRGYLKQGETVLEFQAGYAGHMVRADGSPSATVHEIYRVEADGSLSLWLVLRQEMEQSANPAANALVREEELIVNLLQQATFSLRLEPARKIYLDPLESHIPLERLLEERGFDLVFSNEGAWRLQRNSPPGLQLTLGKLDMPRECLQTHLTLNLTAGDGHLWIVGPSGGGKEMALSTAILSLALSYSPEECQFYLIDAANDLTSFENLPHTGTLLRSRPQDRERFERLMRFLNQEMDKRLESAWSTESAMMASLPHLVLIINNFKEVRNEFEDEKNVLERIVRDGSKARVHLVVTTNRAELPLAFRNNINHRVVLGITNREEHNDLIGAAFPLFEPRPGRGYFVEGTVARECQIALPPADFLATIRKMTDSWQGPRPVGIGALPACISLREFPADTGMFPIGRAYSSLENILLPPDQVASSWLVVGKSQTGKSNFLACMARGVLSGSQSIHWSVRGYALKRSQPLFETANDLPKLRLYRTASEIEADIRELLAFLKSPASGTDSFILLLVDDASTLFKQEPALKPIQDGLNALASQIETTSRLFVMIADQYENLQPLQFNQPFIRMARQNQFGIAFSKDQNDLMILGVNAADVLPSVRKIPWPIGRGMFIRYARWELVQTPLARECPRR